MAQIVYALAASHSPMLTLEGKRWSERGDDDRRNPSLNTSDGRFLSYDELARENGAPYGELATEARFLEVEAASQRYFHQSARSLNAEQSAMVAAILPNPRKWAPPHSPSHVFRRQGWILRQMPAWIGRPELK